MTDTKTMSAEDLRDLRIRLGLNQGLLADRLGVTQPTLSRWEAGKRQPGKLALNAWRTRLALFARSRRHLIASAAG